MQTIASMSIVWSLAAVVARPVGGPMVRRECIDFLVLDLACLQYSHLQTAGTPENCLVSQNSRGILELSLTRPSFRIALANRRCVYVRLVPALSHKRQCQHHDRLRCPLHRPHRRRRRLRLHPPRHRRRHCRRQRHRPLHQCRSQCNQLSQPQPPNRTQS